MSGYEDPLDESLEIAVPTILYVSVVYGDVDDSPALLAQRETR